MSLLDEVAAHGLAFCKSNNDMLALKNVLTLADQLTDEQKLNLIRILSADVHYNFIKDNKK